MAYQFTCIINGENIELEKMTGETKLSELLETIANKSGIPTFRQQLMAEHGNIDTKDKSKRLNQLDLSTNCHLLIIDNQMMETEEPIINDNTEVKAENDDDYYEFPLFKPDSEHKMDGIELIEESELNELFLILFGCDGKQSDIDRWFSQGLDFNNHYGDAIRFGLLQIHGGPCGVMAPIQGYILGEMLFNAEDSLQITVKDGSSTPLLPTNEQRTEALIRSLIKILSKLAIDETFISWIVSADRFTKKYHRKIVKIDIEKGDFSELRTVIELTLSNGLLQSRIGIICFVLSVLLCRSIPVILSEVDDKSQPLILPTYGHCSQELVNLIITGKCVTNIFDGNKCLGDTADSFVLKGIDPNQEIGFLTTLEPMRLAKVGNNYKCPSLPIWVVGSQSHYTTLFTLDRNVSKITKYDKKRQQLRAEFNKFDVEEQGIIQSSDLANLLRNLQSNVSAYQIKHYFETGTVILWSDFERVWKMVQNQQNYGFFCNKCTFWNKMDASLCNVCMTSKGDAPIIEKKQSIDKTNSNNDSPPLQFTMYLYNGLKATKKDRPQITKLTVWPEAEITQFHSESEELQSLIRCKFPMAIVEYDM